MNKRFVKKAKETGWISGETPPLKERPGVYRRRISASLSKATLGGFAYYNGRTWYKLAGNPLDAMYNYRMRTVSSYQNLSDSWWKGLNIPPQT